MSGSRVGGFAWLWTSIRPDLIAGWDHRAGDAGSRLGEHAGVIRSVVIHLSSEQPLLADLYGVPSPADVGLLCTNLRSLDGKRPVFIDRIDSTFFFPYLHIRFLEIPPAELQRHLAETGETPRTVAQTEPFAGDSSGRMPAVVAEAEEAAPEDELDPDEEIDEDFLQRVRDI